MLNFTKRERILLVVLGVVVVFAALFYFVYRPVRTGLNALRDDLQILEEEGQAAQFLLMDAETYADILERDRAAYGELRQKVLSPMLPEEIDALMTGIITSSGLTPMDLSIDLAPAAQTDPETGEALSSQDHYTVVLRVKGATVNTAHAPAGGMDGTFAEMIRLIDTINSTPGMSVREYTYESGSLDRPVVMTVDLFYFDEEAFDRVSGGIETTAEAAVW